MFVVAGVTGHVGAVVAQELIEKNQRIKVIVRDANKGMSWSQRGAEVAVGSLDDAAFLTSALKGATGFFALLPPNYGATDFYSYQRKTSDAIATAVKQSGVKHVVMLSSIGADLSEGTGPIKGLHYLENALRGTGVKLTAIRAGYFQENLVSAIGPAAQMEIFADFMGANDAPRPMIATKDIGLLAAKELMTPAQKSETIDLHGPSYSARQQALMLGTLLQKRLKIVNVPQTAWIETLMKAGFSKHISEVYAEMYGAFASGKITPHGDRFVEGTTGLEEVLPTVVAKSGAHANLFGWIEIPVKNLERAQTFYERVFELKTSPMEMGPNKMAMFPWVTGGTNAAGALVHGEGYTPSKNGVLAYMSVKSIEATLERVKASGGKVLSGKQGIGEHGCIANFEDSEGNRVAIHAMS